MGVTVLGIQHRTGEFQGYHYDNYNLHCVEEVSGDTWQRGSRITYVEKVPAEVFYAAFLSTLSLRRATAKVHKTVGHFCAYETNFMGIASSC